MISSALILPPLRNYWHLLLYAVGLRFAVRGGCSWSLFKAIAPSREGGSGGDAIMKVSCDYISGKLECL